MKRSRIAPPTAARKRISFTAAPGINAAAVGKKSKSRRRKKPVPVLADPQLEAARAALERQLKLARRTVRDVSLSGKLGKNNILRVSTGLKMANGAILPEKCVVVHVRVKDDVAKVCKSSLIPALVPGFKGIKTDVVATGLNCAQSRPALGGSSMAHARVMSGSMACLVTRASTSQPGSTDLFVLGANHSFADCNSGQKGIDHILQPSWSRGGGDPSDAIAVLADYVPLDFNGGTNQVDCAIGHTNPQWVSYWIETIGEFNSNPLLAMDGMEVMKVGATTGLTTGRIETITHQDYVWYGDRRAWFNPLIKIRPDPGYSAFSREGDSGALVLEARTKQPIGLIVSGDNQFSYACHYYLVLNLLRVNPF